MPDLAKVLKAEIARIARREAKVANLKIQKDVTKLRKNLAETKRRLDALEQQNRTLAKSVGKLPPVEQAPEAAPVKIRATGEMIKKMRLRKKLSQTQLATLLGVSQQSIYQWERKSGTLVLRAKTRVALQKARALSDKQVREILEAAQAETKATKKPAKKKVAKKAAKKVEKKVEKKAAE